MNNIQPTPDKPESKNIFRAQRRKARKEKIIHDDSGYLFFRLTILPYLCVFAPLREISSVYFVQIVQNLSPNSLIYLTYILASLKAWPQEQETAEKSLSRKAFSSPFIFSVAPVMDSTTSLAVSFSLEMPAA